MKITTRVESYEMNNLNCKGREHPFFISPNKINDAAREASSAQAREILHMKEQITKLRADYLALVEKKKPAGRPKKKV